MISLSINIREKIGEINAPWSPLELVHCNDHVVYLAKFEGEYPGGFHTHAYDELFFVHKGEITIQMKEQKNIVLSTGEIAIVPKGVEHCPKSAGKSFVLMFEPNVPTTPPSPLCTSENFHRESGS